MSNYYNQNFPNLNYSEGNDNSMEPGINSSEMPGQVYNANVVNVPNNGYGQVQYGGCAIQAQPYLTDGGNPAGTWENQMVIPGRAYNANVVNVPNNGYGQMQYGAYAPQAQPFPPPQEAAFHALVQENIQHRQEKAMLKNDVDFWARECMFLRRKEELRRKKAMSYSIEINKQEQLVLVTHCDGCIDDRHVLSKENIGQIVVKHIRFVDYKTTKKYICVVIGSYWMILDCDKARNKKYVYQQFCTTQIQLNPAVKRKHIEEALEEYILPCLVEWDGNESVDISTRAGWDADERFWYAENAVWYNAFSEQFPILSKHFTREKCQLADLKSYISALEQLFAPVNRLLMMIYPIMGILYSFIYQPNELLPRIILNCIPTEAADIGMLAVCMQVFNRDIREVIDADIAPKKFEKILEDSKDEVLLIDARDTSGGSYSRSKKKENISKLISIVTESRYLGNNFPVMSAVVLVSEIARHGNILNLFYTPLNVDVVRQLLSNRTIEKVLTEVVKYVESRTDDVKRLIQKQRALADVRLRPIAIAYDVLCNVFDAYGIDLKSEAHLPELDCLVECFFDELRDNEERKQAFIEIVRKGCKELTAWPASGIGVFHSDGYHYSMDRVYFPKAVLERIFEKEKQTNLLYEILPILREEKMLIVDTGSNTTKKLQIDNNKYATYCFVREFFNPLGLADIVESGREDGND